VTHSETCIFARAPRHSKIAVHASAEGANENFWALLGLKIRQNQQKPGGKYINGHHFTTKLCYFYFPKVDPSHARRRPPPWRGRPPPPSHLHPHVGGGGNGSPDFILRNVEIFSVITNACFSARFPTQLETSLREHRRRERRKFEGFA